MMAGDEAPNFTLLDHSGRPRTLSALLADGPVVLFFFPMASSPICTAQACHFRDLSSEFARVGAQRIGISTDTIDKQRHFARQRSFDYPLLSDADGVVSELFGVRRGTFARLRRSVAVRETARHSRHARRRGLLARLLPVKRTTFVIDTDRTIVKVVRSEVRASVHADAALTFLETFGRPQASPDVEAHADERHSAQREGAPAGAWSVDLGAPDELDGSFSDALTTDRIDSGIELALEARVEALSTAPVPPPWPRNDVRQQIVTWCAHGSTVAEVAARLSLPLGATRYLIDALMAQGYLRVHAPHEVSKVDERRELLERTLIGLRAL